MLSNLTMYFVYRNAVIHAIYLIYSLNKQDTYAFLNGFSWIPMLLCKSSSEWFMNQYVCTCLCKLVRSCHLDEFLAKFSCFPVHFPTESTHFANLLGTPNLLDCCETTQYSLHLMSKIWGHGSKENLLSFPWKHFTDTICLVTWCTIKPELEHHL